MSVLELGVSEGMPKFIPEGFRGIDVYGVSLNGMIHGPGIIKDFNALVDLVGNYSQLGGTILDHLVPVNQNPALVSLTKLNNSIEFDSPVFGVSNICLNRLVFQISDVMPTITLPMNGFISLTVRYKFQGE
jgi:hypothetical protein